jgi:hypothetical protein
MVPFTPVALAGLALHPRFSPYVHVAALGFLQAMLDSEPGRHAVQLQRLYLPSSANARPEPAKVMYADRSTAALPLPTEGLASLLMGLSVSRPRIRVYANDSVDAAIAPDAADAAPADGAAPANGPRKPPAPRGAQEVGLLSLLSSPAAEVVLHALELLAALLTAFPVAEVFVGRGGFGIVHRLLRRPHSVPALRLWTPEQRLVQERALAVIVILVQTPSVTHRLLPRLAPLIDDYVHAVAPTPQPAAPFIAQHSVAEKPPGAALATLLAMLVFRARGPAGLPQDLGTLVRQLINVSLYMVRGFLLLNPFLNPAAAPAVELMPVPGSTLFAEHAHTALSAAVGCLCIYNSCVYRNQPPPDQPTAAPWPSPQQASSWTAAELQGHEQLHYSTFAHDELVRLLGVTRQAFLGPSADDGGNADVRAIRAFTWDHIYARVIVTHDDLSPEALLLDHDHRAPPPPAGAPADVRHAHALLAAADLPDFVEKLRPEERFAPLTHQYPLFTRFALPALLAITHRIDKLAASQDPATLEKVARHIDGLSQAMPGKTSHCELIAALSKLTADRGRELDATLLRVRNAVTERENVLSNMDRVEQTGIPQRHAALRARRDQLKEDAAAAAAPATGLSTLDSLGTLGCEEWRGVLERMNAADVQADLTTLEHKKREYVSRRARYAKLLLYFSRVEAVCMRAQEECKQVKHLLALMVGNMFTVAQARGGYSDSYANYFITPDTKAMFAQVHHDHRSIIKVNLEAAQQQHMVQQKLAQQQQPMDTRSSHGSMGYNQTAQAPAMTAQQQQQYQQQLQAHQAAQQAQAQAHQAAQQRGVSTSQFGRQRRGPATFFPQADGQNVKRQRME